MVVNINGKRIKYSDCWLDTTTDQYQSIVRWDPDKALIDRDYLQLFRILSKSEYKSFVDTPENQASLWDIVSWVIHDPFPLYKRKSFWDWVLFRSKKIDLPKALQIRSRFIEVPREIRFLSIGQNIHARQELDHGMVLRNTETGKFVDCDCYSMLTAIYLQPLVDGCDFDFEKAKVLEKEIREMPITEIRPIGFFLLNRVLMPGKSSIWKWLKGRINPIRKERRLLVS